MAIEHNSTYHVSTEEIIDICKRQGRAFEGSAEFASTGNDIFKTVFTTGENPVILYSRKISFSEDGVNAYLYRNPTYTGGTAAEVNNPNDINPQDPTASIVVGATVTDDGILSRAPVYVFGNDSNQGNGSVLQVIDNPQHLPPNSDFLLVIESRDAAAQEIASVIEWCEPERIPGLSIVDGSFVRYSGKLL